MRTRLVRLSALLLTLSLNRRARADPPRALHAGTYGGRACGPPAQGEGPSTPAGAFFALWASAKKEKRERESEGGAPPHSVLLKLSSQLAPSLVSSPFRWASRHRHPATGPGHDLHACAGGRSRGEPARARGLHLKPKGPMEPGLFQ